MVNGNDIYSHFNDVLNVNEAKLCFPRTATLHPPGIEVPFASMPLARSLRRRPRVVAVNFSPRLSLAQLSVVVEGFHTEGDVNLGTNLEGLNSFISRLFSVSSVSAS